MAKVLVSMNAFKGSISTKVATDAVALAFEGAGFQVEKVYLADGGDGTIDVAAALGGRVEFVSTFDPVMRPIEAPVAWLGQTAVIEMAKASGMTLISAEERNPMLTTTWGLSLIHISEPTRLGMISYAVFCLKKKKKIIRNNI